MIRLILIFLLIGAGSLRADLDRQTPAMTLSNYSDEERENNIRHSEAAFSFIKLLAKEEATSLETTKEALSLSYKLANFFQQNDRAADGEIVLALAFQILGQHFPHLNDLSPEEACERLGKRDPLLPALYAALLHYKGKAFLYVNAISKVEKLKNLDQAESYLKRSLAIRKLVDTHLDRFVELDDNNVGTNSRHTSVFYRTLGIVYLEKGDLQAAEKVFKALLEIAIASHFHLDEKLAREKLIKIYFYSAHQEWDQEIAHLYYQKAHVHVESFLNSLKKPYYSGLPSDILISIEFFCDPANPYYDLLRAKELLEDVLASQREFPKKRVAAAQKKLKEIYLVLSSNLERQSSETEQAIKENYHASKISPLLKASSKERVDDLIALATLYRERQLYLQAGLLLSNALSKSASLAPELQEKLWYELFLTEKACLYEGQEELRAPVTLTFSRYQSLIEIQKRRLSEARQQFSQRLDSSDAQELFEAHRELTQEMENIF